MCGIAGYLAFDPRGVIPPETLAAMVESMRHRGPDHSAIMTDDQVGLGIARLAVIDPAGSNQPISNEDGSVVLVFNGEIYNYLALRRQLAAQGHEFATSGDGEVVVHGYERWGEELWSKLRGMYAIALWDRGRGRLILARDRMGIKPLYLYRDSSRIVFSSEIRPFFAAGLISPALRSDVLDLYLTFRYVPAPATVFKGVEKLLPGEYLVIEGREERRVGYYRPRFGPSQPLALEEATARLETLLQESVELRLQSDRPLGVFSSGGLDSSLLVALVKELSGEGVDTFSVGFTTGYNELKMARLVAESFGTRSHELLMDHRDYLRLLPEAVRHLEEPVADPSCVPIMAMSRVASRHVTVVLSGEGGDELFAGYPRYYGEALSRFLPALPRSLFRCAPARRISRSLRRGLVGAGIKSASQRHLFWQTIVEDKLRESLLPRDSAYLSPLEVVEGVEGECDSEDPLARLFYLDIRLWLVEDLLLKKDKMTMSSSLEARVPFLDQEVVDFACRLPARLKVRGRRGKYVLRQVIGKKLPAEVLRQPKVGFTVPLALWLRRELAAVVPRLLLHRDSFLPSIFSSRAVACLHAEHLKGVDLSLELFSLLVLELWGRIYLRDAAPEEIADFLLTQAG